MGAEVTILREGVEPEISRIGLPGEVKYVGAVAGTLNWGEAKPGWGQVTIFSKSGRGARIRCEWDIAEAGKKFEISGFLYDMKVEVKTI